MTYVTEGHFCRTPRPYTPIDAHSTNDDPGTIWECECGKWWVSVAGVWNKYALMGDRDVKRYLKARDQRLLSTLDGLQDKTYTKRPFWKRLFA